MSQQLLPAPRTTNWFGIFLHAKRDTEDNLPIVRIHAAFRPLVGWTSAEGGWQGLYYCEKTCRLVTPMKLGENNASVNAEHCIHLADFSTTAPDRIRRTQAHRLRERLQMFLAQYERLDGDRIPKKSDAVAAMEKADADKMLYLLGDLLSDTNSPS
jgi:hypothetical protein